MPTTIIDNLTESVIEEHASPEIIQRGDTYWRQGAVGNLVLRGNTLTVDVQGSDIDPYLVSVTFGDKGGVTEADCTCPYTWGGWCKHIVAAMLAFLHSPEDIEEEPTTDDLLSILDGDSVKDILRRLIKRHPRLIEEVTLLAQQTAIKTPQPGGVAAPVALPPVDARAIRSLVRAAFRGSGRRGGYRDYGFTSAVVNEVGEILDQARNRLEAGDGRGALAILEAITEEYIENWNNLDDSDGYAGEFFSNLGEVWTEAILSADLTPVERRSCEKKLDDWQDDVSDYGIDEGFNSAAAAARQGWDDPKLVSVLRGDLKDQGVEADEEPDEDEWYFDNLTRVRLTILQRQGRLEEALRLASWAGMDEWAALLLVRLDRCDEAEQYACARLDSAASVLEVARELQKRGDVDRALRVAEAGLGLDGRKHELAGWLRDLASQQTRPELALRAGIAAFKESPELNDWRQLAAMAGDGWPALREELLHDLRDKASYVTSGRVDVLLHEGQFADAVALVRDGYDYSLVGRVVDAATSVLPNEVIPICHRQAESIMDSGNSAHYDAAARWLARSKIAHHATGRDEDWRNYLSGIMAKHKAKYKLMPLLRELIG